jgi:HEAT repeat protein
MSKEVFRALDLDVERLIIAGGGTAGVDEGLLKRKDAFDKLATQVPVLRSVSEQIGKVAGSKARAAATELLNLGVQNLKLRGAQIQPFKPEGTVAAMPQAGQLDTPLASFEIDPLYHALTRTQAAGGKDVGNRNKIIEDAVERGAVFDLRLLELWVEALKDSGIADMVQEKVIPRLGESAMPRLEPAFKRDGGSVDARRLACIVTIRGAKARALVDACVEKSAVPVRAEALRQLLKLDPAAADRAAVALFKEKNKEIREACVEVVAAGSSEAGLGVLIAALDDVDDVSRAAVRGLQAFKHPATTERVFALLTPEALDIKPYVPPKVKKGTKLTKAQTQANQKEQQEALKKIGEKTSYVQAVLRVLEKRHTPKIVDALIELFNTHKLPELRSAAGDALLGTRQKKALLVLIEQLGNKTNDFESQAINAFFKLDPATVYDRALPYFSPEALADKKRAAVASTLLDEISGDGYYYDEDPEPEKPGAAPAAEEAEDKPEVETPPSRWLTDKRWADLALKLLDEKLLVGSALTILGYLRDKRAFAPLAEMFPKATTWADEIADALAKIDPKAATPLFLKGIGTKATRSASISALAELKAPQAVAPLIELLPKAGDELYAVLNALSKIGDKRAAVPIVQLLADKKVANYPWRVIQALKTLDDPGCLPALKVILEKARKSKAKSNQHLISQYEELVSSLERDRTLA